MNIRGIILRNISVHKQIRVAQLLVILLLLIIIAIRIHLRADGDDLIYFQGSKEVLSHGLRGFLEQMHGRYMIWSGRISVDAITILTITHPYFFKMMIPCALLLTAFSINRIVSKKVTVNYIFFIFIFLLLIPENINNEAVWWVMGSYNYLLPLSMATYALSFIFSNSQSKIEFIACIFAILIASYSELMGFYFLAIATLAIILNKFCRTKKVYFLLSLFVVNYGILLLAPGNYIRYVMESLHFFPEYMSYSIFPKLFFGFDRVYILIAMDWNFPFIFLLGLFLFLYPQYGKKSFAGHSSYITIIVYFILMLIKKIVGNLQGLGLGQSFFGGGMLIDNNWYLISTYVSYFFVMMLLVSCIMLTISIIDEFRKQVIVIGIFTVGVIDTMIMGFSPTVYVSSYRTDYCFEICLIITCVFFINHIGRLKKEKTL